MKPCNTCGVVKPLAEFYDVKRGGVVVGQRARCRACCAIDRNAKRRANPGSRKEETRRRYERHAEHLREEARRWYAENSDRANENARKWREANPDRRAESNRRREEALRATSIGNVTPDALIKKAAYWGNRCWMCGEPDVTTMDHVKPLSKGGAHVLANMRPACMSCNSRKHAQWPFPTAKGWSLAA